MLTNYVNGIASYGVPVMGGSSLPSTTGNYWFVSSTAGSDGNSGKSVKQPVATIAQAHTLATASNGDVVVIMPGHVETVSGAAYATLSKAGVSYVGLGNGRNRPVLTWSATASQIIVSGAGSKFENVVMNFAGIDAVVAAVSVTAADVAFVNCEIVTNVAAAGAVLGIVTAATATRFTVDGCRFIGTAANTGTTTTAQIKHEVGIDYVIKNSYFTGKMTQSILNATAVLGGLIDNNRFVVATGTVAITMHASSTPFISNNRINVPSGTAPIVAAAGFVAGNAYSAAAGVTAGTALTI